MADKNQSIKNFEKSLDQLEDIVRNMEQGDLSLEQSLDSFERGITLAKECQSALNQAELRIKQLVIADDDSVQETDFNQNQD